METLKSLLHFIYTDEISEEKITVDLLGASDVYDVLRLKDICCTKLMHDLSVKNVGKIWHNAYVHNLSLIHI